MTDVREWLRETHGASFELLRHFLLRFFDSELVTSPGQTAVALIGSSSMFLTWFPFVTGPLKDKYAHLRALSSPESYRWALRADELWLIVMMMSAIGLLTAIKWQSLFPTLSDYRAIGWMPVRARQIFGAKLAALLMVATGAVMVLALLPGVGFPALSGSPVAATLAALVASCYFMFFALVAIQGVVLNVVPPRRFARVTGSLQAFLAAGMLILLVLSFSIGPPVARWATRPEAARWLPPVWFLGVCDPSMPALASRAKVGLAMAVMLVLAAYTVSYRRHRALMMEGVSASVRERRWVGAIFEFLVRDPREQAVMAFLAKGIAGEGPHRMILMGYGGFGVAVLLGLLGRRPVAAAPFVFGHIVLLTFLLLGLRHSFSIPVELRANWAFRITEGEGRAQWRRAMDRFVIFFGAVTMILVPLPLELRLLGWRGLAEAGMFAMFGLACYQAVFASWEKLPLTCSYLPGKSPMWMVALRLMGLLTALPLLNAVLLACLYNWMLFAGVFAGLAAIWVYLRRWRMGSEVRLKYEEAPDPAIHGLNLGR